MSYLDHHLKRKKVKVLGMPSEPVGSENRICQVKSLFPSADDTLTSPEIFVLPSDAIPSSSTSIPISPGASTSSGVKRTYSESTALPNSLSVSSGSGVKSCTR